MKKLIISIFANTAIAFTAFSQNPLATGIDGPMKNLPKNLSYSNYKTYIPFIDLKNEITSNKKDTTSYFEGSDYSLGFYTLQKGGEDADFKMIVEIRLDTPFFAKTTTKDSLVLVCGYSSAISVFDKMGMQIYQKEATGSTKSGEKGLFVKKNVIERQYFILLRNNIEKIAQTTARPFEELYFPTVQFVFLSFMEFATSFKNDSTINQTERAIADLKATAAAGQPELYIDAIRKYMPYWESLTHAPEGKKQENIKSVGFYNLWASNMLLKDTVKAKQIYTEHPGIAQAQKLFLRSAKKAEMALARLEAPPQVTTPVHPDNLSSSVTFKDIEDQMRYITFKGRGFGSKGTQTGTFKVERPEDSGDKVGGGIYSINRKDVDLIFIDGSGTQTKTKISDYNSFIDEDGNEYIVRKSPGGALGHNTYELHKSIKKNARITVYKDILSPGDLVYFKKAGTTELFLGKFLNEVKSLAEYFSDCSSLAEKIRSKEIKTNDYEQICDLYETCN